MEIIIAHISITVYVSFNLMEFTIYMSYSRMPTTIFTFIFVLSFSSKNLPCITHFVEVIKIFRTQ